MEHSVYRKSGESAGLHEAAGQHQAAVSFIAQTGCAVLTGDNALFSELARTRPPPLCPSAHHSPSCARRAAQDCCGKARRCALLSSCSAKLLVHAGVHLQCGKSRSRAAALLGKPSRVAARGARGRCGAWIGSWTSWISPSMHMTQPIRTAPLPRRSKTDHIPRILHRNNNNSVGDVSEISTITVQRGFSPNRGLVHPDMRGVREPAGGSPENARMGQVDAGSGALSPEACFC